MPLPFLKTRILFFTISSFFVLGVTPYSKAQNDSLSSKIDQYLQERMNKSLVPGMAVAIVHHDTVILSKGYGKTSSGSSVRIDTPFPIASLSKAFTATAILQLVDEGKIDLDAPLTKYLPAWKINDDRAGSVTVRHLLNQTSGLSDKGFAEFTFYTEPSTLNEFIIQMKNATLTDTPGKKFHYHNPNFRLLAAVVESVSGSKFSDYMSDRIFKPLGMSHTADYSSTSLFYQNNYPAEKGHVFAIGKSVSMKDPEWFVDGAAGMVSTADDMARWLRLQLHNGEFNDTRLMSAKTIRLMRSTPDNVQSAYGMGWFVRSDSSLYHSGILWTYSAEALVDVKNGYGVVLLFNGGINPFVDYYSFLQGVIDIINDQEPEISSVPNWIYPVVLNVVLLFLSALVIRSIFRVKQWKVKYHQRVIWKSYFYLTLRILPFSILIFLPWIVTAVSGRVLSAYRIFLMAPDLLIALLIFSLLNLILAGRRVLFIYR